MDRLIAAHALKFPLLQKSEELDLYGRGQIADLVEEKGSPVRLLKPADRLVDAP